MNSKNVLWFALLLGGSLLQTCSPGTSRPWRVLTGGIRHESNTFCTLQTTASDFTVARGEEALAGHDWARALLDADIEVIPTLHAYARPFGVVQQDVYEQFRDEILDGAKVAGPVDAVYLDLHGALHAEGYEDAQLDLITRLRNVVGDALICASFDLHGNISDNFASQLDILTAYRTAPHVDGAETKERAVRLLLEALQGGHDPEVMHINIPILIPGEKGITSVEPLKGLYGQLDSIAALDGVMDASIFCGMPWTDVPRAGMSAQVVAADATHAANAREVLAALAGDIWNRRAALDFDVPAMDMDSAIIVAKGRPESTVFITDSGDNTTGGAAGDMTYALEKLFHHAVDDAVFAGVVDREAVLACEAAGVGADVSLRIGGYSNPEQYGPLPIDGTVTFLTPEDQRDTYKRAAVVQVEGVAVVLLAVRRSFTAPEHFHDVEIDPLKHKIVVTKLGYLFPGLREIAPYTIMALTPGFANQDLRSLEYHNVERPIYPLDPGMAWSIPL